MIFSDHVQNRSAEGCPDSEDFSQWSPGLKPSELCVYTKGFRILLHVIAALFSMSGGDAGIV